MANKLSMLGGRQIEFMSLEAVEAALRKPIVYRCFEELPDGTQRELRGFHP